MNIAIEKIEDAENGLFEVVDFDPDEAEFLGAFEENALSVEDAKEAIFDDVLGGE